MTIAVTIKVHDGIVIASDSATTMMRVSSNGTREVVNVYNHANKIFNLIKGYPIGAVTAGVGSMSHSSISTLAKDLRRRFSGDDDAHANWHINPAKFTIQEIAEKARDFFYDEHYKPTYGDDKSAPGFDFFVCGYSSGASLSELWKISVASGKCAPAAMARDQGQSGIDWAGEPEAICRLLLGISPRATEKLHANGVDQEKARILVQRLQGHLMLPLYSEPMPVMDAIDLAEFLVYATVMFTRFNEGAPTVGGPIEIAAITKHEGFKWVRRKHYFTNELNPEANDV